MRTGSWCFTFEIALVLAVCALPAEAYFLEGRWSRTATNGTNVGPYGTAITLTWSIAPDGTQVPGNTSGTVASNFVSYFDAQFGAGPGGSDLSQRPWLTYFDQAFARISALSGISYIYDPKPGGVPTLDDGRAFSNSSFPSATAGNGAVGVRGDVRIGARAYGNSTTLASNYYPDYGEMIFNSDMGNWFASSSNNYRRLRNTIMHEALHGLGINHVISSDSIFLMEPTLNHTVDGPQLDDLLALHRLYGDAKEKNGGNNTYSTATPLGLLTPSQSLAIGALGGSKTISANQVDFVSISGTADTDFYSFAIDSRADVRLNLTPRGTTYMMGPQGGTESSYNTLTLNNLALALFDTNGTSLLDFANNYPAGGAEEIVRQLLPGTYYARITGTQDNVQLYGLNLFATSPLPRNLVWIGNLSSQWNSGGTANFSDSGSSAFFYDLDHVTFDDTSAVKNVSIQQNLAAGNVRVTTASSYTFTGAGMTAGTFTVDGSGIVTLANSGNSYGGSTQVLAGTLAITGDANAMATPITVAAGGTLLMNASDAAAMSSSFTIHSGGVLQIGILTSEANVFPDNPGSIVNNGTIRVLDEELLRNVSGSGQIHIEHEITTLKANDSFSGSVLVMSGATARLDDSAGLGSSQGLATVEQGGAILVASGGTIAKPLSLAGSGSGGGALRLLTSNNATFTGGVTLATSATMIHAEANAAVTFTGPVNGAASNTRLMLQSESGGSIALQNQVSLGTGGITKQGAGNAMLAGALDYSGSTRIEEGTLLLTGSGSLAGEFLVAQNATLQVAGSHLFQDTSRITGSGAIVGSLTMPGTIAPGSSTGTLSLSDNLTFAGSSLLEIELAGTTASLSYDVLNISGGVNLAGSLDVSLIDSFMPMANDTFEIIRADGGVFGAFSNWTLPSLGPQLSWNLVYSNFAVLLQVVEPNSVAIAGDYNGDNVVDAADYVIWRKSFGQSGSGLAADGYTDGVIDERDYDVWSASFGETVSSDGAAASVLNSFAVVPEPTALVLWLIGSIMAYALRRRRPAADR